MAGVVAALAAEARALGPASGTRDGPAILADGTLVAVSGIGGAAAARASLRLIAGGATALVSWGMAGALDPALRAGAVCVPSDVIAADGTGFSTTRAWREPLTELIARQRPVTRGTLLSSLQAIDTVAAKAAAYKSTRAAAVDMESFAVAQIAATYGLPFIAVRVIVDMAGDALPRAVVAASQAGQLRLWRLLAGLIASPGEIAPLFRLAQKYRVATRSLMAVAGLGLGSPGSAA